MAVPFEFGWAGTLEASLIPGLAAAALRPLHAECSIPKLPFGAHTPVNIFEVLPATTAKPSSFLTEISIPSEGERACARFRSRVPYLSIDAQQTNCSIPVVSLLALALSVVKSLATDAPRVFTVTVNQIQTPWTRARILRG